MILSLFGVSPDLHSAWIDFTILAVLSRLPSSVTETSAVLQRSRNNFMVVSSSLCAGMTTRFLLIEKPSTILTLHAC